MHQYVQKAILLFIFASCNLCIVNGQRRGETRYSYLEKNGATCKPQDTCSIPRKKDNLWRQRCQCGPSCIPAGSCCIDSPHIKKMPEAVRKRNPRARCQLVATQEHMKVYMVDKCAPNWRHRLTRALCERQIQYSQNERDPLPFVPVTNPDTQTTYKNYFCAVCNNDEATAKQWEVVMQTTRSYKGREDIKLNVEDVRFDENRRRYVAFIDGKEEILNVSFTQPDAVKNDISMCVKDLTSDCAPGWRNENVRRMCHAYMAIVFIPDGIQRYRNVFCALCNHVRYENGTLCRESLRPLYVDTFNWKPPSSLTLTLDVNFIDGDRVGSINRCGKNSFFDPLLNKCRPSKCMFSGYVRNNRGVCTRVRV